MHLPNPNGFCCRSCFEPGKPSAEGKVCLKRHFNLLLDLTSLFFLNLHLISLQSRLSITIMSTHGEQMAMHNRPDEWKIEQGIHGASLPILDQSSGESRYVKPYEYEPFKDEAAIKSVGDPDKLFAEEREGWSGYVEWENYPEKKEKANKILTSQNVRRAALAVYLSD
jgi:hypothetical protein